MRAVAAALVILALLWIGLRRYFNGLGPFD
jgi:hypothetical protein